ncbi:hypothetical protein LRX75_23010 [Rhizobium sp. DKSPLA3]|uniref:Uncharacterized protein n=1 Tax=Rhizobium quercicola TaxID=2901226 RepID=A0A9X1NXR7_9HYPH|nr:hypothetical protein [Rhizobium quercicola]MCD7111901.1 hypothetical protein [Rhizobium quercicola]
MSNILQTAGLVIALAAPSPREATIARWSARIAKVPDFRFEIRDVVTMGNRLLFAAKLKAHLSASFSVSPSPVTPSGS